MTNPFNYSHDEKEESNERVKKNLDSGLINFDANTRAWYSYTHKYIFTEKQTDLKRDVEVKDICRPSNLKEVINIILRAEKEKLPVRAAGSGHSYSDVYKTNGLFVDTHLLKKQIAINTSQLKSGAALIGIDGKTVSTKHLIQCETGLIIRDLNKILDKLDLGLINMGGYDGQTVIGVASTSTHGTGITLPPFCDMLLSLVLVSDGGKCYRIEPKNGITDPAKYSKLEDGHACELIQDDDTFNSVICSMGCMGIIYSYILQVRERYFLKEVNKVEKWEDVSAELAKNHGKALIGSARNFNILVNPYIADNILGGIHMHKRMCLTQARDIFTPSAHEKEKIEKQGARERGDGVLQGIARSIRFNEPQGIARALNTTFDLVLANDYQGVSHEVYIAGGAGVGGYACEWSFPLHQTLEAMDAIFRVIRKAEDDGEQVMTAPISIRFVKSSRAYLSPQHGRDSVMFELLMIYSTPGKNSRSGKNDENILMHRFFNELLKIGGRPHWGLEFNDLDVDNPKVKMKELYPKWDNWVKVFKRFNSRGTFNNSFTKRLGLS